jgi:membrane associated rhomboid family serine protease
VIPLRDSIRSRRFPILTVLFIVANVLVFLYEVSLTRPELVAFTMKWGFTPALLFGSGGGAPPALTLVTSTFIHGGWTHLGMNMLFLWVFGDNIEDRLGRFKFVVFYLLTGVAANLAHALASPGAEVPVVGASGAIAGVLGAYFLGFPRARITSLIFLGFFVTVTQVPAVVFLVFWFALQLFMGLTSYGAAGQTVAWWAHIGGFAAGIVLFLLLRGPGGARVRT